MSSPVEFGTKTFGTMSLTAKLNPQPFEESVKVLNYVKDKYGVKFFNCGEFYQMNPNFENLKLFRMFLDQVDAPEEIIVNIKGCIDHATFAPNGSKEFVEKSINHCLSYFDGMKARPKIIFEPARVDPNVPIEETVKYIHEFVKAGKIDGIALSEVGAETIRKVAPITSISAIEIEFSLVEQHIIDLGILQEASKHKIPILAYSALGRGLLTNQAIEADDFIGTIAEDDSRKVVGFEKFTAENFAKNKPTLKALYDLAKSKGMSLEAFAVSFVQSVSHLNNFEGIDEVTKIVPLISSSTPEKVDKNFGSVSQLSKEDIVKAQEIVKKNPLVGRRYNEKQDPFLNA